MSRKTPRRAGRVLLLAAIVAAAGTVGLPGAAASSGVRRVADPIPGRYIVSLAPDGNEVVSTALALAADHGGRLEYVYSHALRGFSIAMSDREASAMSMDPRVAVVEQDPVVSVVGTQSSPPYGLDRIDQRDLPLSGTYNYGPTASTVSAYIIDTGIRVSHSDFGGRASHGYDFVDGDANASDCNGHGTHVAGTVGGATYGVAKAVALVAVRVLDCGGSGSGSDIIAGIDWVTANHQASQPAVANMSLGTLLGTSSSIDAAVRNSIADGITYAIAAGNGGALGIAEDACNTSPSRVAEALTVSATDRTDRKASFANYGTCVDVFAPGVSVTSAWYTSDSASNTISGTSMAAPHVAGVAAQYLENNPSAAPATVASAINGNATTGKVTNAGSGSPNRLLYNGFLPAAPPPPSPSPSPTATPSPTPTQAPNSPPTASFSETCSGLTCNFTDTSSDTDGNIVSRSWDFGDGTTSSAANPSHTYPAAGTYTVALQVTDDDGATASTTKSVTVSAPEDPDPSTPTLANGIARSDTNGAPGTWRYYKIEVPGGKPSLKVEMIGPSCGLLSCNPDLDLYVRKGAKPTTSAYNCRNISGSSTGSCTISNPGADWWYLGVYVYSGTTTKSYTVKATY